MLKFNFGHLVLALVTVFMFSCDVDEETTTGSVEGVNGCKLTEFVESGDDYGDTYAFTYDGDQLTNVNGEYCYGNECDTYSYDLSYDGSVVTFSSEDSEEAQIIFDGDKLSKLISSEIYEGEEEIDEYRYTYSGDKLLKVENWDNYSGETQGEFVLYSRIEMTYSGNNISGFVDYYEDFESSTARKITRSKKFNLSSSARSLDLVKEYEVELTYDDKINPFKGSISGILRGDLEYFNENNIVTSKSTEIWDESEFVNESEITYEYNEDGFPLNSTEEDSFGNISETDYTYDCE